ncbi:ornithine decarboxylase 1-like [Anopheles aquasalis]|uniref:ornithine decarboxylase 1-like n=1 Tax=Anopheles aquasalis TaxID=42839 RepID=UPI00215B5A7C|nr:ornithine decarboxylase 1-like [Anopheles aquasalis]
MDTMDAGYILIDENSSVEKLIKVIAQHGMLQGRGPVNVLNLDDVVQKHQNWRQKLPSVVPFYAVKCNNHPAILQLLVALGCGFDCASQCELQTILGLGVAPEKIIYANPAKTKDSILYARKMGVKRMTFDSVDELEKIAQLYTEAELVLRIRYDAREALLPLGRKFGCDPDREALPLLRCAKRHQLSVIGVSFHVGCGSRDAECYYWAIRKAIEIFDSASELGMQMHLLDIGGGYPGGNDRTFDDHVHFINKALSEQIVQQRRNIEVIAEPGRYCVESAVTALVNVLAKSYDRDDSGEIVRVRYYLDDGLYDSFDWCDELAIPEVQEHRRSDSRPLVPSVLYGRTMCDNDIIAKEILLPEHEVDDCLVFPNRGAYGMALGRGYNGFSTPLIKICLTRATLDYLCLFRAKVNLR